MYYFIQGLNKITEDHIVHGEDIDVMSDADLLKFGVERYDTDNSVHTAAMYTSTVDAYNAARLSGLEAIKVTTSSGKTFDGDEKSQDRMVRAIQIAGIIGQTETTWRLADNTDVVVVLDELKEALALAGQEMSRIWLTR